MRSLFFLQKHKKNIFLPLFLLLILSFARAQQSSTVLPANGTSSQTSSPQGGLRYQRGFYLISPNEVKVSGLTNGMAINSIGFTIGAAQKDTTKGAFKVYLQNTTDTISRVDTAWTTVTSTISSYNISSGLFAGNYEWQVRALCSSNSLFSPVNNFTNDNLTACSPPTNLSATNIGSTTATLNWDAPAGVVSKYYIFYKLSDTSTIYQKDSSTSNSYSATGLLANKNYQWRVITGCATSASDFAAASFSTNSTNSCSPAPSGLTANSLSDTSVTVSFSTVTGANYYNIQYRRVGTSFWNGTITFTNSINIKSGLTSGTLYEWQVGTVCSAGTGSYVSGPNFTTVGSTKCYPPENLSAGSLTDSSVTFKWTATAGATSYEVRYRLKSAISWSNAITPLAAMTLVHADSLIIPKITGSYDVTFKGGNSFTYTGNGVYVAWEYSQSSSLLTTNNTALTTNITKLLKGFAGQDSVKLSLSFIGKSDSSAKALPTTLTGTPYRPETRLGSSSLADSVAVLAVYALGNRAPKFQPSVSVSALIANKSATANTYNVTLTIKEQLSGAVRSAATKSITISQKDSAIIQFADVVQNRNENDSLIVSISPVAGENVVNNNTNFYLQSVNSNVISYADSSLAISSAGFNTNAGLLLVRDTLIGCGKVIGAQIYLSSSAKDQSFYAVALDKTGAIVAKSPSFTPDSLAVNTYHSFYFDNPASFLNERFYIGLAQIASVKGANPVGTQWEGTKARSGAYYRANLDGSNLVDSPKLGRLMIKAEIVSSTPEPLISGDLKICTGATNTLTAKSYTTRFADSLVAFSSQYSANGYSASQALGTPNVYPANNLNSNAWVSSTPDGQREFLVVRFADAAPVNYIDIYETSNAGSVDTVYVKNPATSNYDVVYTNTAVAAPPAARKNRITFTTTTYNVNEVRIALNSKAVAGYNAIDAIAIGQILPAAFSSYLWAPGGETASTKTISSAGIYTLTTTNANGCQFSDSINVTAANTVAPVVSATRSTTFCQGDSVVLRSNKKGGNTWSTGATTDSITVKIANSYTVSYNDGSGCGILTSAPVSTTVNTLPVVTISGILAICPGGSTTLDAGAGYTSYLWSAGATTQTINVTNAAKYTVTVKNSNGCSGSANVTTTISPVPSPAITGALQFCPGGSTILDAGAGYNTYKWSTGETTQTIVVSNANTFTVTVTNASGCSGMASVSTSLLTPPTPSISGGLPICPGGSVLISANAGYAGYLWSTGETTQSINVSTVKTYSVTVTAVSGCTGTASIVMTQATPPSPAISGTLSFCGGSSTILDAGIGYNSYLWSNNATSRTIIVTVAGSYAVSVTDTNGCTGSTSATTTAQGSIPVTPSAISGNTGGVCNSTGNVYSISAVPNASYYVWTVPTGATITSGQSTTSISVSFSSSFTGGNIVVAASNACGQSPSNNPRTLAVQAIAATPGFITGQTSGLCGLTAKVYTVAAVNGASSYTWTVPAGATITSGQGTTSITLNYAGNFGSGNICVNANSNCGNSANSCITVTGLPPTPNNISGPATVCSRQKNVTYSIAAVVGASTYTWTVPAQATIVSGQGTNSIVVSFATKSGNVSVTANNGCGTSAAKILAVTIGSCTASVAKINELYINTTFDQKIKIYPNPTTGLVNINIENGKVEKYQVQVLDGAGRLVYQRDFIWNGANIPADLRHLAKGIYSITVFNTHYKNLLKLVIL